MNVSVLQFDDFAADLRARELRKSGVRVRLQDQPFHLLAMLLERPGEIVTRDEIRLRLWPNGTFVDFEHSVNAAIKRLRAALGDTAENPRFVETLHRRGYRFIAPIGAAAGIRTGVSAAPSGTRPRLVVLPFTNLGDSAQDYFADGLTEELIAQIGRQCGHQIGVLARTSSMVFKDVGRGAGDIGEALRADYLVEGSVRRVGDRVRITAQLIETRGETHLWADSYDRRLEDFVAVQTDVASHVAKALAVELLPATTTETAGTRNAAAYHAFLQGRFHWNKAGDSGLSLAIEFYDRAIALDADFGRAYSARGRALIALCDYYRAEPSAIMDGVRDDAMRALAIDPGDAEAHVALAEVYRVLDWNGPAAESAYRCALEASPSSESTHRYYAHFLAARGRVEARAIADRACALDPLCLVISSAAADVHYLAGDYETAVARCRHTLAMDPSFGTARRHLGASLAALGRYDEALDEFSLVSASRPDPLSLAWMGHTLAVSGNLAAAQAAASSLAAPVDGRLVPAYHLALVYAGLNELDHAFEQLDRACLARDPSLDTLRLEPRFSNLRRDPRFNALLERTRLTA